MACYFDSLKGSFLDVNHHDEIVTVTLLYKVHRIFNKLSLRSIYKKSHFFVNKSQNLNFNTKKDFDAFINVILTFNEYLIYINYNLH